MSKKLKESTIYDSQLTQSQIINCHSYLSLNTDTMLTAHTPPSPSPATRDEGKSVHKCLKRKHRDFQKSERPADSLKKKKSAESHPTPQERMGKKKRVLYRRFDSRFSDIEKMKPSTYSYKGLYSGIQKVLKAYDKAGTDGYVLGPRYSQGDTQCAFAGKQRLLDLARMGTFLPSEPKWTDGHVYREENPYVTAGREAREEGRIIIPEDNRLVPLVSTEVTQVFGSRASDCSHIAGFNPTVENRNANWPWDLENKKMKGVVVVHGTFDECQDIVLQIERSRASDPLLDDICGISIIPLKVALEWARNKEPP